MKLTDEQVDLCIEALRLNLEYVAEEACELAMEAGKRAPVTVEKRRKAKAIERLLARLENAP